MRKKRIGLIPALLLCVSLQAQSVSPQVIASGGYFFSSAGLQNSVTIGEMALTETYTASGFVLTQGFQQPTDSVTAINDYSYAIINGLSIFPNPSSGNFTLTYTAEKNGSARIEIYNALGALIKSVYPEYLQGAFRSSLDLGEYSNGVYYVRFIAGEGSETIISTKSICINH